jgi:translation initiation factor 1
MGKKKPDAPAPPVTPFHNPFGGLGERLGMTPAPAPAPAAQPARPAGPPPPARAVLRLERKGRGGKEATVVEKLGLRPAELERWCAELKKGLGCGGAVEGDAIAIAGDQRERVKEWLVAKGVAKVTIG